MLAQVITGTDYLISAGTSGTPAQGDGSFQISCDPEVYDLANDECAGAIPISNGNSTYDSLKATTSFNSMYPPMRRDQYFTYTATCTGVALFRILEDSTLYFAQLAVLSGTCASSSTIQGVFTKSTTRNIPVTSGTSYIVRAGTTRPPRRPSRV